ncbi:MAG: DUF445 domain-containing protein [Ectothiorhodospiraceae bacterium AqS1]|nr:DUF445 domain-containing protein [Ectothiorhodospiraceae bacterium AqS1]
MNDSAEDFSRQQKRLYVLAFLKLIMADDRSQSLGQDEKNHTNRILSRLSTEADERMHILCWATDKAEKYPGIKFSWMNEKVSERMLIDIFAYLNTVSDNKRKEDIITSDLFKELRREFTDERISFLQNEAFKAEEKDRENQGMEKETGDETDDTRNEEVSTTETPSEEPEEMPTHATDEYPGQDQNQNDSHRVEMKERLRKAKRFATGLLAAMAAIFILHWIFSADYPGSGMVMAFAAAAMIGGLADWYAVTALFRNPLYIPEKVNLPHTAIIPKRKDEIGEELANFVKDKILVRGVVEEQLRDSELTRRMGEWLQDETNARRVNRDFSEIIEWFRSTDSSELLSGFKRMLTGKIAQRIPANKALAAIIDVLTTGNNTQVMIDELTQFGIQQIDHNRDAILEFLRKIFKNEDGWLMRLLKKIGLGGMTDEKIGELYTKFEPEVKQLLNEIRNDPKHPIRIEFNNRLRSWHEKLMNDESTAKKCDHLLEEFLRNEAVRDFFQSLWDKTRDAIYAELKNESSDIRRSIEREIQNIGKKLSGDTNLRKSVDNWLGGLITNIVVRHSDQISKAISDTIKTWDAKTTAESIELQIGRDLQFIRINGTVVGGLIGIVIYLLTGFHH